MNMLKPDKQVQIVKMLVEGNSIRSIERITGTNRNTIMRLLVLTGQHCQALMDERLCGLTCKTIQIDEIWCFVKKKEANLRLGDPEEYGHTYTFVAMDSDTKLVIHHLVGKRDEKHTRQFMRSLRRKLASRVQITTDAFPPYFEAVPQAFGYDVDFAQTLKKYRKPMNFRDTVYAERRYSPSWVVEVERKGICGWPIRRLVSTSHVERQNLTMRMQMRRFTRLTNGFSKKLDNLKAAVTLHFAWYNFVRTHRSLGTTPAVAAKIVDSPCFIGDLIPSGRK